MAFTEISQIVEKASRLLFYGLINPKKIINNLEYQTLYQEYCQSSELQMYVSSIAKGMELSIIAIERDGIYLNPTFDSPFIPNLSDLPILKKEKNKALYALIIVAISAYFFPTPTSFHDQGISKSSLNPERLHQFILEKIQTIKESDGEMILQGDPNHPEIDRLLVLYSRLKKVADNRDQSTAFYLIQRTFDYLTELKLLTEQEEGYFPTIRFRLQMEEFSNNAFYLQYISNLVQNNKK